jgi:hypothetical protein
MIYTLVTIAVTALFAYITYQSVKQLASQKDDKVPVSTQPIEPIVEPEPEIKRVYQRERPEQPVDEQPEEEVKKPDYTLKDN